MIRCEATLSSRSSARVPTFPIGTVGSADKVKIAKKYGEGVADQVMRDSLGLKLDMLSSNMSALNAHATQGASYYLRSKGEAEGIVLSQCGPDLKVTVFQPSLIVGAGDASLNRFAHLLESLPGPFFPLACPDARFAPAERDGILPDEFYSTTNFETLVRQEGRWVPVLDQKMDCAVVLRDGEPREEPAREEARDPPQDGAPLVEREAQPLGEFACGLERRLRAHDERDRLRSRWRANERSALSARAAPSR